MKKLLFIFVLLVLFSNHNLILAEATSTSNITAKGFFILNKELISKGAVLAPVFSHNSKYISFVKKDEKGFYNLYVNNLDSKETVKVTNGLINWDDTWKLMMRANPWSNNDEYLLFPSKNKTTSQKFGDKEASVQIGITSFDGKEKALISPKDAYSYYPSWFYKSSKIIFINSPANIQETSQADICVYDIISKNIQVLLTLDCKDFIPTGLYPSFNDEKLAVLFAERGTKNSLMKVYNMADMAEISSVEGEGRKMAYLPVYWTKDNAKIILSKFINNETDSYLAIYNINDKKLNITETSLVYPYPISDTKFFAHAPLYDLNTLNVEVDLVFFDLSNNIRIPIGKNIVVNSYDLASINNGIVKIVFWDRFKKPNEIVVATLEEREVSEDFLKQVKDNEIKNNIAKELFASKVIIYEIISLLQDYFDKDQKYPPKLETLVKAGKLNELPKDNFGYNINYKSSGKQFVINTYPYMGWSIIFNSIKGKFETKFIGTSPE